jgi:hypothetical protein
MERVEQVKNTTVLQSLRAARFEDVTILGSQYRDPTGASSWYIALWSERNIRVRIYRLSGGELSDHVDFGRPRGFAGNRPSMGTITSIATNLDKLAFGTRGPPTRREMSVD